MWRIVIGVIVSLSVIIGYFIRKYSGKEVNNFLKDHKEFKIFKKYRKVRASIYGIVLSLLVIFNLPELSVILFGVGLVDGGVFSSKKLKKILELSAIIFIVFIVIYLIQKPF